MKAITFILETQQPVLATSFQGDPNSDVSYSYLPGSMIRGALIGRYLQRHRLQNTDILTDETVRRLFFDGSTRYLNGYLYSHNQQRTLPLPKSWIKEKKAALKESELMQVYDLSVDEHELEAPKPVGEYFWEKDSSGSVILYTVNRRINIHNLRDRRKGRSAPDKLNPTTNKVLETRDRAIFRYDALDAGQSFQAVILCTDIDVDLLQNLLDPPDIWIGGSQSAGYGHNKISNISIIDKWNETNVPVENRQEDATSLSITLLSDLIIRDKRGQYVPIAPTQLLCEFLGVSLTLKSSYVSFTTIGGFNRKWGLPLPQIPAIEAGSVFVYNYVDDLTTEQILTLKAEGIGERRVEGFGRIAVNLLNTANFKVKLPKVVNHQTDRTTQSDYSRNLATQMAERILCHKLENLLLNQVQGNPLTANQISNSQLSRLVLVAREALSKKSRQPIDELLKNLTSTSRTQFNRARIGDRSLTAQLKNWLNEPLKIWSEDIKPVKIADVNLELTEELAMEYALRLIMAIAKQATKEKDS
ncbi:RAMP superfamily protein [Phormidium pseudopriestleyi FRX01]|uniref:RAMP superfamily protein n=1 Tax=Phormidium pseudopriestleyi FRX01 TaxID=1759528 RepID=A0ABS3FNR3_9CYAN|nr:RAMP superfamily CRISPR-associated protein [Phormidium pseudopriestleyi]MBO0348512.1 RAMP superfamily protein [Phormidium pseudopriestleyi FRX01]